jgi:transposase
MSLAHRNEYNAKQAQAAAERARANRAHIAAGKSVPEIARLWGVTRVRIYQLLQKYPD